MDITTLLTTLIFLAGVVNRIVEAVKQTGIVQGFNLPANLQDLVFLLLSIFFGVLAVVGGGSALNLFALSPVYGQLNPMAGQILTGIVVALGANALYALAELLTGRPAPPSEPAQSERILRAHDGPLSPGAMSTDEIQALERRLATLEHMGKYDSLRPPYNVTSSSPGDRSGS